MRDKKSYTFYKQSRVTTVLVFEKIRIFDIKAFWNVSEAFPNLYFCFDCRVKTNENISYQYIIILYLYIPGDAKVLIGF